MHCAKCGSKIMEGNTFCTSCGHKVDINEKTEKFVRGYWSPKKGFLFVLISIAITSLVWLWILGNYVTSNEDEVTNVVTALIETIGRQQQAWQNSETMVETISYVFSDECLASEDCIDNASTALTTLRANVDKEVEEIGKVWSETAISSNFGSFYSNLDASNQMKIDNVMNTYFPDEEIEEEGNILL